MLTMPDLAAKKKKKIQAWKEVALHPQLFAGPAGGWPFRTGTGRAPAASAKRYSCRTTAGHMYVLVCKP